MVFGATELPQHQISVHPNPDRLLTPLLQELVYHKIHNYKRKNKLFLLIFSILFLTVINDAKTKSLLINQPHRLD